MPLNVLGEARFPSPIRRTVSDHARIPAQIVRMPDAPSEPELLFEIAGPRPTLFFDPKRTRAAIVTCGGLCPGVNNVIRSIFLELHHIYGVSEVLGFRGGYQGLDPAVGAEPVALTPEFVDHIHKDGGTVLGTSRGPVDLVVAVDTLIRHRINILFTVGGDGRSGAPPPSFRKPSGGLPAVGGGHSEDYRQRCSLRRANLRLPDRGRGGVQGHWMRAHGSAERPERNRPGEGDGAPRRICRGWGDGGESGGEFYLVPEVPFALGWRVRLSRGAEGAHPHPEACRGGSRRRRRTGSAGECAGEHDASGNIKLRDIGPFLRERIESYCRPRNSGHAALFRSELRDQKRSGGCGGCHPVYLFARNAVHAAMVGKTGVVIGLLHDMFIHVPIDLLVNRKNKSTPLAPRGTLSCCTRSAGMFRVEELLSATSIAALHDPIFDVRGREA